MLKRIGILIACIGVVSGTAWAEPETVDLYAVKAQVEAVNQLAEDDIITGLQAKAGVDGILERTEADLGHPVTVAELETVQGPTQTSADLTWLQKAAGFVSFTTTMIAIASIMVVAATIFLFGKAIVELLKIFVLIPAIVYESTLVLAGVLMTGFATTLGAESAGTFGLIGALLYGGGFVWIVSRHDAQKSISASTVGMILAVAWGASALLFQSQLIGALSVAALMSALGFSALMVPGVIVVGFTDEDSVPRAMMAAFLILAVFVGVQMTGIDATHLATFRGGALYVGGFVAYLGALIVGTRYYGSDANYVLRQLPMIVGGIGAIYLGSVLGIPELQKMGGTFFVLYLLEKPYEIPIESATGFAFITLVVGSAAIGGFLWANNNLEVIAPYFLFV